LFTHSWTASATTKSGHIPESLASEAVLFVPENAYLKKMTKNATRTNKCKKMQGRKCKQTKTWEKMRKQCNRKNQANEDATNIPHSMQMSKNYAYHMLKEDAKNTLL